MLSDTVTEEHVADVISRATGIPLGSLLQVNDTTVLGGFVLVLLSTPPAYLCAF